MELDTKCFRNVIWRFNQLTLEHNRFAVCGALLQLLDSVYRSPYLIGVIRIIINCAAIVTLDISSEFTGLLVPESLVFMPSDLPLY